MKATRLTISLLLLFVLLSACSSNEGRNFANKPEDVSEEFWDEAIQITLYIKKHANESKTTSWWGLTNGLEIDLEEASQSEKDIKEDLYKLAINSGFLGTNKEEQLEEYEKTYSKLETLFGSATLENTELDEEKMSAIITKYKELRIAFKEAEKEEEEEKIKEITSKLDEMENAVKNEEYEKAREIHRELKGLKDSMTEYVEEASAMISYIDYLESEEVPYKASYELAMAVKYNYDGRMKAEIAEAVMDTSFTEEYMMPAIDDLGWKHIESGYYKSEIDLIDEIDRELALEKELIEKAKGKNPTLGMTTAEVEASLWGKPEKINRSVNQFHVREQWVYGQRQYLYFTDGILTSFQD